MRAFVIGYGYHRTAAPRCFLKCFHLMLIEIKADPVVHRLHGDADNFADFVDGAPLCHQQHSLHPLEGAFVRCTPQRLFQPRLIITN